MQKFEGTLGPWSAVERYVDSTSVVDPNGFSHVSAEDCAILLGWDEKGFEHWADSDEAHRYLTREEQRANAQLIASAPELLEALQSLFAHYKQLADSGDAGSWRLEDESVGQQALAAINKALGK